MIWSRETLSVNHSTVNNCSSGKEGKLLFIASYMGMKMHSLQQSKANKGIQTAWF